MSTVNFKLFLVTTSLVIAVTGLVACNRRSVGSMPQNEDLEVRKKLESYERGELTLDQVTSTEPGAASAAWVNRLLSFYSTHSNSMAKTMLLPISRCYAVIERYPEALQLAQDYVEVRSNDWHAWRIIGTSHYSMDAFDKAAVAYANAVRLGDDCSCSGLAIAAMKTDQDHLVKDVLPRLVVLKKSKSLPCVDPLEISAVLMMYSLRTEDRDIFIEAIDGLKVREIISRPDLPKLLKQGCLVFKSSEGDELLRQITDFERNKAQ